MAKPVATAFLQAIVVVIPIWLATSQFFVQKFTNDDGLMEYDGSWNDITLFIFSSYVTLAVALIGIYLSLEPLSFGLRITFAALIVWMASAAVFMILSLLNSKKVDAQTIEDIDSIRQNPIFRGGIVALLSIGGVVVCLSVYSSF